MVEITDVSDLKPYKSMWKISESKKTSGDHKHENVFLVIRFFLQHPS